MITLQQAEEYLMLLAQASRVTTLVKVWPIPLTPAQHALIYKCERWASVWVEPE